MKALLLPEVGGPEKLVIDDIPTPTPAVGLDAPEPDP